MDSLFQYLNLPASSIYSVPGFYEYTEMWEKY